MSQGWFVDESQKDGFEISGAKITFKKDESCYNHYNGIYFGLCANEKKKYYWEFEGASRCSVGLVTKSSFGPGFKISGCFFNGNLSDGSCLISSEFGDSITDSQKIGLILDLTEEELKVYIVQENRPLGLAYIQKAPYSQEIHPAIIFTKPGSASVYEKDVSNVDNLLLRTDYPEKTKNGKYLLQKTICEGVEKNLPSYELTVEENKINNKINLNLRVINSINGFLAKKESDSEGDLYEMSNITSTLMAGDPNEMQNEFLLAQLFGCTKRFKHDDDFNNISLISPKAILEFKRHLPKKEPNVTELLK